MLKMINNGKFQVEEAETEYRSFDLLSRRQRVDKESLQTMNIVLLFSAIMHAVYFALRQEWKIIVYMIASHFFLGIFPVTALVVSFRYHEDMTSDVQNRKLEKTIAGLHLIATLHTVFLFSQWYHHICGHDSSVVGSMVHIKKAIDIFMLLLIAMTVSSQVNLIEKVESTLFLMTSFVIFVFGTLLVPDWDGNEVDDTRASLLGLCVWVALILLAVGYSQLRKVDR